MDLGSESDGSCSGSPSSGRMATDPPANEPNQQQQHSHNIPLSKRIACVSCRKKKLRCDGARPSCGTCTRLQRNCIYEEARRKSGPKRGYVKMLEERLAHVEGLLKTSSASDALGNGATGVKSPAPSSASLFSVEFVKAGPSRPNEGNYNNPLSGAPQNHISAQQSSLPNAFQSFNIDANSGSFSVPELPNGAENLFELIALGMDEPLPPKDMIDELTACYFDTFHQTYPMIHKPRFDAAMNYQPQLQPPIYLRYAMWAIGAVFSQRHVEYAQVFYVRARKYLEQQQMRSHGECMASISFLQAWVIVCLYEFRAMFFPRAWVSAGIACRLALMMLTNGMDADEVGVKSCMPPPSDWIETEERRRTFWAAFCADRYASVGTGWPLNLDECDINSDIPASEEAFNSGVEEKTCSLAVALSPAGAKHIRKVGVFGAHVVVVALFGQIHLHLHRGEKSTMPLGSSPQSFLDRFRQLDTTVHTVILSLPNHIKRPIGPLSTSTVQVNMALHAATICLHQATIFRTRNSRLHEVHFDASRRRCLQAASEITQLMQSCSHLSMGSFDAFMSFCVYIAARCFVQAIKISSTVDVETKTRLDFLLTVLDTMKDELFIAQSFLFQLEADMAHLYDGASVIGLDTCGPFQYGSSGPLTSESEPSDRSPTDGSPLSNANPSNSASPLQSELDDGVGIPQYPYKKPYAQNFEMSTPSMVETSTHVFPRLTMKIPKNGGANMAEPMTLPNQTMPDPAQIRSCNATVEAKKALETKKASSSSKPSNSTMEAQNAVRLAFMERMEKMRLQWRDHSASRTGLDQVEHMEQNMQQHMQQVIDESNVRSEVLQMQMPDLNQLTDTEINMAIDSAGFENAVWSPSELIMEGSFEGLLDSSSFQI